ncbi:FHA domain-containing protein [Variovorax sp. Sphag1AA]|uniref:FHA domain-containing protein n=1 Tax=Variovorax sp. Sphag1AA TaxID=2587027 RepID=UPI001619B5AE|nr:FHA domain-containing protein [Variovorax sp. Sphag1AA]MBB3180498.1 putative component of type VI protein secretion system [Variovorax sp. Sphag1AA]
MPKLIVSIDGVVIKEVTLAKDRTTLGRRPYNDIVVDNLAISGEHAVLHMIGGDVYLEDLNSTNGTYVNGRPIKKQALEQNDVIEVGKYKVRYVAGSAGDAATAIRAVVPPAPSGPIPLSSAPTVQAPLGGGTAGVAVIRVLSGSGAGRELSLQKVVTTIGKPGVAVAAVTRRLHGYVVAPIDGGTALNGEPLGSEAVALQDGDVLELGGTRMQFVVS